MPFLLFQFVELLLFTLYPMLCVITLTWLSSAFIASVYVPYVFLLTGFVDTVLTILIHANDSTEFNMTCSLFIYILNFYSCK